MTTTAQPEKIIYIPIEEPTIRKPIKIPDLPIEAPVQGVEFGRINL